MPFPTILVDQTNTPLVQPSNYLVVETDNTGNLVNGTTLTVFKPVAGALVNDIAFTLPTVACNSIIWNFTTGSGWSFIIESSLDGQLWLACPSMSLSRNTDSMTFTAFGQNGVRWCADTIGGAVTRMRLTAVGSTDLTITVRNSSYRPSPNYTDRKSIPFRLATTTAGLSGVIKTTPSSFEGYVVKNTAASDRYLHLYNQTTTPVLGTNTIVTTFPLLAGASEKFMTGDIGLANGIAFSITTDYAGTTLAATSEVLGTLFWTT